MRVTLQDIATRMGVTPSTVQRALSNAPGVSERRRVEIKRVAEEMAYRPNMHASSLRRGTKRVAVVLPNLDRLNRFFAYYIWQGIDQFVAEASTLDIELVRIPFINSPKDHHVYLQKIGEGAYGTIDGIITRGSMHREVDEALVRLHGAGMPVVLVGNDLVHKNRLSCVMNYESMQGRMAADLLTTFSLVTAPSKIIVCGNFAGTDQYHNAKGFERRIWESRLPLDIHKISYDEDPTLLEETLQRELKSGTPVHAIYTCSTRSTIAMCKAVESADMGGKVHTIGSDIFQISAQYMRQGILQVIMHSRPTVMAHRAAQVMAAYLTTGEVPEETILIDPCIVLPGSLDFYVDAIPNFQQEDRVQFIPPAAIRG